MRRQNARTLASRRDPPAEIVCPPRLPSRYHNRCFLCSFNGLFASIFAIVAVSGLLYYHVLSYSEKFAIIIDGGSTGTRMHVFVYRNGRERLPTIDFGLTASMKVVPGLSAFADDPEKAVESLMELLKFGKDRVPKNRWMATEIRLMATAGLRLLNGDVAEAILESCRKALRESGFNFRDDWASVISGR
ncbi:hypothetical protein HPP92_013049 [Vanilla planifolia]|uniref:Apyrase n=1 Tax=Vanilla planifolia TaxID=51239 RepID=A0A835QXD5_VANPL|nr:hypothetical protein HPP92_013049 [Vanilla planifolia]